MTEHTKPSGGKVGKMPKKTQEDVENVETLNSAISTVLLMCSNERTMSFARKDMRIVGAAKQVGGMFGLVPDKSKEAYRTSNLLIDWANRSNGGARNESVSAPSNPKEAKQPKGKKDKKEAKPPPPKRVHLLGGLDQVTKTIKDDKLKERIMDEYLEYSIQAEEIISDLKSHGDKIWGTIRPWKSTDGKAPVQSDQELNLVWDSDKSEDFSLKRLQKQELLAVFKPIIFHEMVERLSALCEEHPEVLCITKGPNSGKEYSKLKIRMGPNIQEIAVALGVQDPEMGAGPWILN
jgi:hypothetical protein